LQYSADIPFIVLSCVSLREMEIELELLTNEKDEIQVMQKVMEIVKKAKELGFSIKELELEAEGEEDDKEDD
jgi:hypothetical protein